MMDKYFEYRKHKTNFKTEVIAGVTTFLTMAYIMFLNPFILSGEFAGTEKVFLILVQFHCNHFNNNSRMLYNGAAWTYVANRISAWNGY